LEWRLASFFDSTTPDLGSVHYIVFGLEDTLADANVDDMQFELGFVAVLRSAMSFFFCFSALS